jgi:hypothetical protein
MPGISVPSTIGRLVPRAVLTVATVAALVVGVGPGAQARTQLACSGGGGITIDKQLDGAYRWASVGAASCNNPGSGVQFANFSGVGQTSSLGFCSGTTAVDAFSLNVDVVFTTVNSAGSTTRVEHQVWSFPATTFPVVTAFTISDADGGATLGTGQIVTHIAGQCPPLGQPSMQVVWVQAS